MMRVARICHDGAGHVDPMGVPDIDPDELRRAHERYAAERDAEIEEMALPAEGLARLITLVVEGRLTARSAQELLPELLDQGGDPEAIMNERGLEAVSDTGVIDAVVDEVIAANPDEVGAGGSSVRQLRKI